MNLICNKFSHFVLPVSPRMFEHHLIECSMYSACALRHPAAQEKRWCVPDFCQSTLSHSSAFCILIRYLSSKRLIRLLRGEKVTPELKGKTFPTPTLTAVTRMCLLRCGRSCRRTKGSDGISALGCGVRATAVSHSRTTRTSVIGQDGFSFTSRPAERV